MDDKIIKKLDELNVEDTEQLLDSIDTDKLDENIDFKTTNTIKSSVLKKAGIDKKTKIPLMPSKLQFILRTLSITFIELLFFTVFAFIGWTDGFLSSSGISIGFAGSVPFILYFILLSCMSLFIYLCMYNIDSKHFSLKTFLPKNRAFVAYFFYMYLSTILKVFVFLILALLIDQYEYLLYLLFADNYLHKILMLFAIYTLVFALLDMLLYNFKNFIVLRWQSSCPDSFKWQFNKKAFLLELLKYSFISCFLIVAVNTQDFRRIFASNVFVIFLSGTVVLWLINTFFSTLVLMKKKHYQRTLPSISSEASDTEGKSMEQDKSGSTKWVYGKQRALVLGASAIACIYVFCIAIPYIGLTVVDSSKPSMKAFSSRKEVEKFFLKATTSYRDNSNDFSEFLFNFNKLFINIANIPISGLSIGMNNFGMLGGIYNGVKKSVTYNTSPTSSGSYGGTSETNIQVEGVDEADIVKTDGEYIYYINESNLFIVRANPPEQMEIIYRHDFLEGEPQEMFLYKDRIAVIINTGRKTIAKTFNIKDHSNPVAERNLELDCGYLTSRMLDNNLYLVASSILRDIEYPEYSDSSAGGSIVEMDYKNLFLMKSSDNRYSKMNVVAAFPIDDAGSEAQVKAYIGGNGENVYVSTDYIYIADTIEGKTVVQEPIADFFDCISLEDSLSFRSQSATNIYRIKVSDGNIGEFDSASVPGKIHNQFSMDERNGYFRLTTQTGMWNDASSNVYVLDENMMLCGSLEGLAPEEHIYSSRFMGNRLYLVTFKQVDPLFVISLADPQNPIVLGKLKIPGYSEYIHPLDENHIIGFGKDTVDSNSGNFAWSQGVKIAIFDVTDVENPKEKFVQIIGDRGSDSPLLSNHKALMYMANLELMAFPVSVVESTSQENPYEYNVFQGAYVYNVNSTEGFNLRGKITHLDQPLQDIWESAQIDRIIYSDGILYTLSGEKVKATNYSDMQGVSEISLR
ncbi:MAG: Beta propeller domain protein [Firmicutes bacterium ADurb.Bin419]|nr:MAG: Beta propeller domain protein [Firmicutes bacterium ADurb.Bin419]